PPRNRTAARITITTTASPAPAPITTIRLPASSFAFHAEGAAAAAGLRTSGREDGRFEGRERSLAAAARAGVAADGVTALGDAFGTFGRSGLVVAVSFCRPPSDF